jgi:TetR/AcrR family transcriptional regulator, cholesterol catabolism regulator
MQRNAGWFIAGAKQMKENKYEKILAEAASLIGEKGYAGTSFQEIADQVEIHKSTLFHYFTSKEELLLKILERSIGEVSANLDQIVNDQALTPEEKLEKAIYNHLTLLVKYFDNVKVYLNEFRSLSRTNQMAYLKRRKGYEGDFNKIVGEMKRAGYFEHLNSKIVTVGILGMLNWTAKWFKMGGNRTIQEVADVYYKMLIQRNGL